MAEQLLSVQAVGLEEAVANISSKYPALANRARASALSSAGNLIRAELRNHIEYGGSNWPKLSPLAQSRKKDKSGKWHKTSKQSPLYFLGKYARYYTSKSGEAVVISFGKSRKGEVGNTDKFLYAIAKKAEYGETVPVTKNMRLKMAYTRLKSRGKDTPGVTYFPLKKSTTQLHIPKRPSIGPVFNKMRGRIPEYMREKFWAAFNRYQTGGVKA